MHTIEIPEIKYNAEIPSHVSELSPKQYLTFVKLLLLQEQGEITWEQFRIRLIVSLMDIRKTRRYIQPDQAALVEANLYQLSELMDSFCDPVEAEGRTKLVLNISFTKNLVPRIGRLYGPADGLTNISFFEYIDAHHSYIEFIDTLNPDALDRLVTILYRPKKWFAGIRSRLNSWDGQKRIPYNDNQVDKRQKKVKLLPYHYKYAVFLWFRGCEEFLRSGEIQIGDSTIKLSLLYEGAPVTSKDNTGLVGVLYTLAESGVFGNAKQTAETNLFDVLVRIYQLLRLLREMPKKEET